MRASSNPAAVRISQASGSPVSATASTTGNSSEKLGACSRWLRCTSCSRVAMLQCSMRPPIRLLLRPMSRARRHWETARWPIQSPEPSSETKRPQPPARANSPRSLRPKATEPVPAMQTSPGPPAKAASRAMTVSPTTWIADWGRRRPRPPAVASARPPPAPPGRIPRRRSSGCILPRRGWRARKRHRTPLRRICFLRHQSLTQMP